MKQLLLHSLVLVCMSLGSSDEVLFTQCECESEGEPRFKIVSQSGFSTSTHLLNSGNVSCPEDGSGVFVNQTLDDALKFPVTDDFFAEGASQNFTASNWYMIARVTLTSTQGNSTFLAANFQTHNESIKIFVKAVKNEVNGFRGISLGALDFGHEFTLARLVEVEFQPGEELIVMLGQATKINANIFPFGLFACILTRSGSACTASGLTADFLWTGG